LRLNKLYDIQAATKVGLPCFAVLTGGIERELLERAGARAVYESAAVIVADLDRVLERGEVA
jgi:phosphoglycolate phosphatase-like HAD superfamily hydrolase